MEPLPVIFTFVVTVICIIIHASQIKMKNIPPKLAFWSLACLCSQTIDLCILRFMDVRFREYYYFVGYMQCVAFILARCDHPSNSFSFFVKIEIVYSYSTSLEMLF